MEFLKKAANEPLKYGEIVTVQDFEYTRIFIVAYKGDNYFIKKVLGTVVQVIKF